MSEYGRYASEHEAIEAFEDMLNDVYDVVTVCGYDYDAGTALRKLDPIAFNEEFSNWLDQDMREWEETRGDEEFELPEGNAVYDADGTLWVREEGDRWTQPAMPAFVPRVTAKQLEPWGPFTKA